MIAAAEGVTVDQDPARPSAPWRVRSGIRTWHFEDRTNAVSLAVSLGWEDPMQSCHVVLVDGFGRVDCVEGCDGPEPHCHGELSDDQ